MAMKRILRLGMTALLLGSVLTGCLQDKCKVEQTYVLYQPKYVKLADLRADVKLDLPQALETPGKIYVYGNILLINEYQKGIHLYNNRNPKDPQSIGFLPILGNVDMAIRDNFLYADSYLDLLVFDLSNPTTPQLVNRLTDVFPNFGVDPEKGIVVGYNRSSETQKFNCDANPNIYSGGGGIWIREADSFDSRVFSANGAKGQTSTTPGGNVGIGGSTARFTINADFLYTVSQSNLFSFSLANGAKPFKTNDFPIGFNIETIFPYDNKLFIGSQSGMFIYDLATPDKPTFVSMFGHVRACDPVVVEGDRAYVTLRDGTVCNGFNNQLDVLNIKDLKSPVLIKSYPLRHPIGLGITDGILMICDDNDGLKVYDAKDDLNIDANQLDQVKGINTFDVIPLGQSKIAIVTGNDGVFQYNFANPKKLELLSKIAVKQ
jgi:hypothetical protein